MHSLQPCQISKKTKKKEEKLTLLIFLVLPMALHSLLFSLLTIVLVLAKTEPVLCHYTSIFNFGDSWSDTGNLICLNPNDHAFHFPYGETYFGHVTDRCSNGRLIVDFIAQALGLLFLPPYLARKRGQEFRRGANFAVAGAKALDDAFFEERGIYNQHKNISLRIQLSWFKVKKIENILDIT
ncbi:hypothetical protein HHK36_019986 [Tetracentron sinense]|uniref:Uncharacterized protein n=1 Tax=Tetracentron sinense TaxID=13715 RepID=A0A834YWE4_TETSI|nr:hypothetical protein HHK36_019986 [Tetracentron sinense]